MAHSSCWSASTAPIEADGGGVVGEDPDHVGASLHLLVQAFERVVRPDLAPMRLGERGERQHVGAGVAHRLGGFGEPFVSSMSATSSQRASTSSVGGEREDRPERGGDHLAMGLGDVREQVAGVVHPAALPGCALASICGSRPSGLRARRRSRAGRRRAHASRKRRRNLVQNVSSSESPISTPRTSRSPSAVIPVAITTARDTTWPRASSRTLT